MWVLDDNHPSYIQWVITLWVYDMTKWWFQDLDEDEGNIYRKSLNFMNLGGSTRFCRRYSLKLLKPFHGWDTPGPPATQRDSRTSPGAWVVSTAIPQRLGEDSLQHLQFLLHPNDIVGVCWSMLEYVEVVVPQHLETEWGQEMFGFSTEMDGRFFEGLSFCWG